MILSIYMWEERNKKIHSTGRKRRGIFSLLHFLCRERKFGLMPLHVFRKTEYKNFRKTMYDKITVCSLIHRIFSNYLVN